MTLCNFKNINKKSYKKILFMFPMIVVVYFFCVKINYSMMDRYSFYSKISMYDVYNLIMNDSLVELLINLPFLLILLISVSDNQNYILMSRFSSRKMYAKYRIKELIYINLFISLVFITCMYLFGYILTGKSTFNWFDLNSPISILFNNSKPLNKVSIINGFSIIFISFIIFFIRNMTISILMLIISKFFSKLLSFTIVIVPFLVSSWFNGPFIHCYMLDINNLNNINSLFIKIFFIILLCFSLKNIYIYLEERIL